MFKKPVKAGAPSPLGGKEAKKFRAELTKRFIITEADLDTFFGAKDNLKVVKLAEPISTALLYCNDEEPYFVDITGRGMIFPTMYAIWKKPSLLPSLPIQAPVSKFVIGGADLMLPGVAIGIEGGPLSSPQDLPEFDKGFSMLVFCIGNPMPIAVGEMLMSRQEAIQSNMKGKCMRVVHTFHDCLWEFGSQFNPPGFLDAPLASGAWVEAVEGGGTPADAVVTSQAPGDGATSGEGAENLAGGVEKLAVQDQAPPAAGGGAGAGGGGGGPSQWEGLSPDDTVYRMLLGAIKVKIQGSDLPCETSKFFSNFMQPVLPEGRSLDIKTTSYKKLAKFLSQMEKKKLLKLKTVFGKECVEKVDCEHKDVVAYVHEEVAAKGEEAGAAGSGDSRNVTEGYKPNNNLVPLLGGSKDDFYTDETLLEAIKAYAQGKGLLERAGVKVDDAMLANLYIKFKEEDRPKEGQVLPLPTVAEHFKLQMTDYYSVVSDGKTYVRKGKPKKVSVSVEDRMGGRRACTIVRNLEYFDIEPEAFVKAVQKKFNTSGTVAPLPGKNETKMEINVQGNLLAEIVDFLAKEHNVDKSSVDTADKTKK